MRAKHIRWVPCLADSFPINAVEGGYSDGNKIFVARAKVGRNLVPGKFSVPDRMTYVTWEGREIGTMKYDILVASPAEAVTWVDYDDTLARLPLNAVRGGYSDVFREPLYIGRIQGVGTALLGFVSPTTRICTVPKSGQALLVPKGFQILVEN